MLGDKRGGSLFASEPAAHNAPAFHDAQPVAESIKSVCGSSLSGTILW